MNKTGMVGSSSATATEVESETDNYFRHDTEGNLSMSTNSYYDGKLPECKTLRVSAQGSNQQISITVDAEQLVQRKQIRSFNDSLMRKLKRT